MKRIYLIIFIITSTIYSYGQSSIDGVLREVEANNPGLKAAAEEVEAQRMANRSEALLENPEIEFNYLWGAEGIGGRHDLRVSQSFDIPTLTGMKSGRANYLDDLAFLGYKARRQEVLLEAKLCCIDLVCCNAMLSELRTHLAQAKTLVESYEKRMKAGEATILDLNKARIHQTSVQGKVSRTEVERQSLLSRLKTLNGGLDIAFDATDYDLGDDLPADFETWFALAAEKSPMLGYVRKEVLLGQKQLAIDRTARLPELSVGYMSEIRTAEKFRGVTLGVNIPLWSGAAKVRQSRARVAAAESRQIAAEQEFYYKLSDLYNQAASLKANSEMMRASLRETDSREFLLSAQTKGEISMVDYLVETDLYYEALEQTLEAEREYQHALANLGAANL